MTEEEIQDIWIKGFETDFWKLQLEFFEEQFENNNSVLNTKDKDDFLIKKGRVQILNELISLEKSIKENT